MTLQRRRIGLTGGIASGKSTVGELLSSHFSLPVLDADRYAREALAAGTAASEAVLNRYGDAVRLEPAAEIRAIDRTALGRIVFTDASERQWLESLIHPLVRQRFATELAQLGQAPVVVLMIPLLFEAGLQDLCSEVWLVSCEQGEQRRRLIERDGLSETEARQRLEAQWPLERKRALADVVIDNDGDRQGLLAEVRRALTPPPTPAEPMGGAPAASP